MARKSSESGSTAYKKIDDVLSSYEWYQQFKQRRMSQSDYLSQVLLHQQELLDKGLSEDQIHLSSRFSLNTDFHRPFKSTNLPLTKFKHSLNA